jgi:chemosensory pili system protein ChpA (sensor histidine kinase/response regulator)
VLIVALGERQLALIVERLVEAREVVVKTMGTLLRRVEGVIGATLMGDGSVAMIVNPSDLAPSGPGQSVTPAAGSSVESARPLQVLIVDDSVSVRRVLTNLVRGKCWTVIAARDGVDALEILDRAANPPDVMLLDIEMPRMDGYEVLTALRGQESSKNLPVIMLTSRTGEKHRRKAFDLGATDYLVKPYEEETLLTVIRRVVREAKETPVA